MGKQDQSLKTPLTPLYVLSAFRLYFVNHFNFVLGLILKQLNDLFSCFTFLRYFPCILIWNFVRRSYFLVLHKNPQRCIWIATFLSRTSEMLKILKNECFMISSIGMGESKIQFRDPKIRIFSAFPTGL